MVQCLSSPRTPKCFTGSKGGTSGRRTFLSSSPVIYALHLLKCSSRCASNWSRCIHVTQRSASLPRPLRCPCYHLCCVTAVSGPSCWAFTMQRQRSSISPSRSTQCLKLSISWRKGVRWLSRVVRSLKRTSSCHICSMSSTITRLRRQWPLVWHCSSLVICLQHWLRIPSMYASPSSQHNNSNSQAMCGSTQASSTAYQRFTGRRASRSCS